MIDIELITEISALPAFGIALTIFAYMLGVWLNKKTGTPFVNPVLISDALIVLVLLVFNIPYENYDVGGSCVELFLGPATAVLAVKIYDQIQLLKKEWLPVIIGTAVGSLVSMVFVVFLCHMFGFDDSLTASLAPKSVTTAIAIPISESAGGMPSITVAALMITGIMGAVCAPAFVKLFRIHNKVAAGVGIGTCSHALGTSKALEIGDVEGAMSGIAICLAGLFTTVYSIFL